VHAYSLGISTAKQSPGYTGTNLFEEQSGVATPMIRSVPGLPLPLPGNGSPPAVVPHLFVEDFVKHNPDTGAL